MTIARAHPIDPSVTRRYHCVASCVRRAFLLGEGENDRRVWIDNRLHELAEIFSISVAGFSVMDNHLHVLVRLDPDRRELDRSAKRAALGPAVSSAR
jgi:REP element-mobilizing transposase RayT